MYNIYNKSECIYLWDAYTQKESLVGTEKDLIKLLARSYTYWLGTDYSNTYLDNFGCSPNETNKRYQFFDGCGRCINPKIYEKDAWLLYLKKHKNSQVKTNYSYWRRNKIYKGTFRRTPVEGISKWRGGPNVKPRKVKPIQAMYANPEYKEFNRGSHKEVPDGWWDDWYRHVEKNWKSQRKTRHQWKER